MKKSKLELFLEEEIKYILENVVEQEDYEKMIDKEHLEKYIKIRLLNKTYNIVDKLIVEEFEEYKDRYKGVLYNES